MTLIGIVALLFGYYAHSKKIEINKQLQYSKDLEIKADVLQQAQLSAYNAVSELVVIFQAQTKDEAINITHEKFLNLLANYEHVTELYPERREPFQNFIRSLADSINSPTPEKLRSLAIELSSFQSELDLILNKVQNQRELLVAQHSEGLRDLLADILLITAITTLALASIVSLFFKRLTGDIKTINASLGRVLYSSSQPVKVELNRSDEVQELAERVAELSERLRKRELSLSLEQRQRAHLEQNKALEHLTRGLVHAIGNPVTSLLGLIQYMATSEPGKGELKRSLEAMDDSVQKLMSINEDLKHLSERTGTERGLLDLNYVISEELRLMSYDDNWFGIDIRFEPATNLPVFDCSKDDVRIVIGNLLENALDALRISSRTELELKIETFLDNSRFIGFIVTDNANGMSEDVKKHAMDAFFTTKQGFSQGDGMGLLSCLNIVEKYGGKLELDSRLGGGTAVTVLFPVYERRESENLSDKLLNNLDSEQGGE